MMAEALILALGGTIVGVAWSLFGVYLGALVILSNPPAAYAIRGMFLAIALLVHGFLRSHTPRLFLFVLLLIIVSVVLLTSPAQQVTGLLATQILYPILMATGVILLVNICIFPEFTSAFMGQMTIETLNDIANSLRDAGGYFIQENQGRSALPFTEDTEGLLDQGNQGDSIDSKDGSDAGAQGTERPSAIKKEDVTSAKGAPPDPRATNGGASRISSLFGSRSTAEVKPPEPAKRIALNDLTAAKSRIRSKLDSCKAAQRECNFELAYSVLSPQDLKSISTRVMAKIAANTIAVISACESKYALLGDDTGVDSKTPDRRESGDQEQEDGRKQDDTDVSDTDHDVSGSSTPRHQKDSLDKPTVANKKQKRLSGKHKRNGIDKDELELVKPKREIEYGDVQLLRHLLKRIAKPYDNLQVVLDRSIDVLSTCVAYAYVRFPLYSYAAQYSTDRIPGRFPASVRSKDS